MGYHICKDFKVEVKCKYSENCFGLRSLIALIINWVLILKFYIKFIGIWDSFLKNIHLLRNVFKGEGDD